MKRRHLVVVVSAVALAAMVFLAIAIVGVGVGTNAGRDQIRALIEQQLASQVQGTVHVGKIGGGLLSSFTLDTFAIRGPDDSLLVSTGKISVDYDPRDLLDKRLLLRNVRVEHPVVRIAQYQQRDWNFQRIFKTDGPSTPDVPGRSFGDFIVLDSVRVRDGEFILTRRWTPDDTLTGVKRDSAIQRNLTNPNREIRRSGGGYVHTHRWSRVNGFLPHVRLAHPDSNEFGREVVIQRLFVEEFEPPFSFRNGRGVVRQQGDSVFFNVPHFELPASAGRATGKIWWGSDLPVRVDVMIDADSVALKDVAWVYETLPRTGGGKTKLHIRNNREDLHDFEYALIDMDARSERSRLQGNMTFVTGKPVLEVRDVDLRGSPINFDLVRTLAGEPLPVDWQGDLVGFVRGPGGPLTNFVVDTSHVTFRDAHVRGAVSRGSGRGELDIVDPELTAFHGFEVSVESLDLRSIQFLFPNFPRLDGTVAGTAVLDSSWLDVRFSEANVTHRNGPGDPTRVAGSGRVTYGEEFMTYDVSAVAQPLSLDMMSNAYPLGLKGLMSGPIVARGTVQNLQLAMELQGDAGRFTYNGRVDAYPLNVGAHGGGRVENLDMARLLASPRTRPAILNGSYQLDFVADTNDLGTLRGTVAAQIERSDVGGIRLFPSSLRARFADRRMILDTLEIQSVAGAITARGSLGLRESRPDDSTAFVMRVDSLGGLRPFIQRFSSFSQTVAAADSLSGTIDVIGTLRGSLASLDLGATVIANDLFVRNDVTRDISGSVRLDNVTNSPTGTIAMTAKDLSVQTVLLNSMSFTLNLNEGRTGSFNFDVTSRNKVTLDMNGDLATAGDSARIRLRSFNIRTDSSRWVLAHVSNIVRRGASFSIDSLVLMNQGRGRISLEAAVPDAGAARFFFRADSVPLRDVGLIIQTRTPLSGWLNANAQGAGTSAAPVMRAEARLTNVRYGGMHLEQILARANYINRRSEVAVDLIRGGRTALVARGSLPIEFKYFAARLTDDTLSASIRTDSASFDIVEAIVPDLRNASGKLVAAVDISGTWEHPDVAGRVTVENGEVTVDALGVVLRGVQVDLGLAGHADSLALNRIVAWSGTSPSDSVSLTGYVTYRDVQNPFVDLSLFARNFHAIDRRTLARLDVSTLPGGIRVRGDLSGALVTGGLYVDRGDLYLPDPELARKQAVDVTQFDDSMTVESGVSSRLFESLILDNVRVTLGDEVFLRSPEARIQLTGTVSVQRIARRIPSMTIGRPDQTKYSLVADGTLYAESGTYTLNLLYGIQREFQVEGGTIVFYGAADLPPELNISALHAVRRPNQADLRIRVRLSGPLATPVLSLESAESYQMATSEIVSYLIFGTPSFALGSEDTRIAQTALAALAPTLQAGLSSQFGRWVNFVQLQPGAINTDQFLGRDVSTTDKLSFIYTSRLGSEWEIAENLYLSAAAGLCQLDRSNTDNGDFRDFANGVSGKFRLQLNSSTSLQAGREPPASALNCGKSVSGRAFIPTPSQWALSFFKSWKF